MKKVFYLLLGILFLFNSSKVWAQSGLSKEDRKKGAIELKFSYKALMKSVKGLSDQQLDYKVGDDSWSIRECVEHIALSEKRIFGATEAAVQTEADPSKRSELKFSDEQVLGFISSRDQKVKTNAELTPQNNFGSFSGSIGEFKSLRKKNLKYLKTTDVNLRNHFFDFPFGKLDAFQIMMFMSGHATRHIKQIEEIKAHTSFPTS